MPHEVTKREVDRVLEGPTSEGRDIFGLRWRRLGSCKRIDESAMRSLKIWSEPETAGVAIDATQLDQELLALKSGAAFPMRRLTDILNRLDLL